jgi:crotonobetainyl-CoA:carnitine CoA-transferase CaiB-like acyl-CoA transferase
MHACPAAHPTIHPYGVFDTADGAPILISIQNEREFAQLCKIVLLDETIPEDPRFCSNVERVKHEPEFEDVMKAVFGSTPRAELCARLDEAKVAYGSVNDCGGLSDHPALRRVTVSPSQAARRPSSCSVLLCSLFPSILYVPARCVRSPLTADACSALVSHVRHAG